jgi:hypothetical protein
LLPLASGCPGADTWCSIKTIVISVVSTAGGLLVFLAGFAWRRYKRVNALKGFATKHRLVAHVCANVGYDPCEHSDTANKEVVDAVAAVEAELLLALPKLYVVTRTDSGAAHITSLAAAISKGMRDMSAVERISLIVVTPWACTCRLVRTVDIAADMLREHSARVAAAAVATLWDTDRPLCELLGAVHTQNNPMVQKPGP